MCRFSFLLALMGVVGLANANKKAGMFNKMQRQMQAEGEEAAEQVGEGEEGRDLQTVTGRLPKLGEANGDFSALFASLDPENWMEEAFSGT